jgi:hypothetical protein
MFSHRQREAQERGEARAEQRRREDEAPRLKDVVPSLSWLRIHFEDRRAAGKNTAMPYTRLIVVATAPAVFIVRCVEPRCDGRHEITGDVMRELRDRQQRSEGESSCPGNVGDLACDRTLVYVCEAKYERAAPSA